MFSHYAHFEYAFAATQLVLGTLGMGATTTWRDFRDILVQPRGVAFALVCQYLVFPLLIVALTRWVAITPELTVGLLLVVAMPSGSITNIFTHLGRGNVPLSITATVASTLTCLVMTPLLMRTFAGAYLPESFEMPVGRIIGEILGCMLVPLAVGMAIGRRFPGHREPFSKWMIRGSLLALACLVGGSLSSGRIEIARYGGMVPVLLVVFGIAKISLARLGALCVRFSGRDAFTLAVEVAVRNCSLAVLLIASLFPPEATDVQAVGGGALYVALFYGGASLVIAAFPVVEMRYRTQRM